MDKSIVVQSQGLLDISIQIYGTVAAVMVLAFANGLTITDELYAGQELVLPVYEEKEKDVADYYARKEILPSTALSGNDFDLWENEDPCNYCKCFI